MQGVGRVAKLMHAQATDHITLISYMPLYQCLPSLVCLPNVYLVSYTYGLLYLCLASMSTYNIP